MLVSVFTPTHNLNWIRDIYQTLCAQTYQNFEWVLVPNGGVMYSNIPPEIINDPRVVIHSCKREGVGALKNFACRKCRGDIFVELDHDDWLMPTCLEEIVKAAERVPDAFYYSNFAHVNNEGVDELFSTDFGWEHEEFQWQDKTHVGIRAFEANARSLCEIYWAPNHVRAWSREAYARAGGHDVLLKVADDHDLVCRTYLAGVPCVHIDKVLYIYRVHGRNTVTTMNAEIQKHQGENRDKYLWPLIKEECRRRRLLVFDISAREAASSEVVYYPFENLAKLPDNAVGYFRISEQLQLVPNEQLVGTMNMLWDKLAPGGWLQTSTPSVSDDQGRIGRGAFQDPRHRSFWSINNWDYYTKMDFIKNLPDLRARFQLAFGRTIYPSEWHSANFIPYVNTEMLALKGQRYAGWHTS